MKHPFSEKTFFTLCCCLLAFRLQHVCVYVIMLTLPICEPFPLGDSSCTNKPFQKAEACDSKAAGVLLSPVLSASGMQSGGMRYKTEQKLSHWALILEQTSMRYGDPETICVSAGPGQGLPIAWETSLSSTGAENALLVRAALGVRESASGLLAEWAGWKGAA